MLNHTCASLLRLLYDLDHTPSLVLGKGAGLHQEHTVADYLSSNAGYAKEYYNQTAVPLDGSDGSADLVIPGLNREDNMVPQGIAWYPAKNWILISSYYKADQDDFPESSRVPSVIFALDAATGKLIAQFDLYNENGEKNISHAGGIAVSENNLYFADNKTIRYVPLSALEAADDERKPLKFTGAFSIGNDHNAAVSYLSFSEGVLWAGNFFKASDERYNTPSKPGINSRVLGYRLSGGGSAEEIENLLKGGASAKANHIIDLPAEISQVQGATVLRGNLFLSISTGRKYDSELRSLSLSQAENGAPAWWYRSIKALPMSENLMVKDGELYCVFESAAWEYHGNNPSNLSKSPTDVVWKIKADALTNPFKYKGVVKCPVDVTIIDKATGETLGCIRNNVVDAALAEQNPSVRMWVDGEEKSFLLPGDSDYSVLLTGTDTGNMKYTLCGLDAEGNELDRVCYFALPLSAGSVYTTSLTKELKTAVEAILLDGENNAVKPDAVDQTGEDPLPPGDVSGDGLVTAEDARLALRAAVGLENYEKGSAEFLAADATKDGAITAEDARLILRAAVGLDKLS